MSISVYNIKKWYRMLSGKSIEHVNQGIGKCYKVGDIQGYYNDLSEKINDKQMLDDKGIPLFHNTDGTDIYFPIMIFQYGLGAYDKYLLSDKKDVDMLEKMNICAIWAVENIDCNGAWNNFSHEYPNAPYSSMAQGEGVSLLLRAYKESGDKKFLEKSICAVNFMLKDLNDGGTSEYVDGDLYMHEFTHLPVVLNGWIFSLFGLYDYCIVTDDNYAKDMFMKSIATLVKTLPLFDNGYWSKYNTDNMITSPFYHNLHIAQLNVLYDISGEKSFLEYAMKWEEYQKHGYNRMKSFIVKAYQKIVEK